jgi:hypothetical protein
MVVRNARRQMISLPVGDWIDRSDVERLRMEIVEAFEVCISDNAMWQGSMKMGIQEPQRHLLRTKRLRMRKSTIKA